MCLILLAYKVNEDYPLVLVANRDEFLNRPTRAADFWEDRPHILGGRDLKSGGTWLGISANGRLAAVTNYREPHVFCPDTLSRGCLVSDFLDASVSSKSYLEDVGNRESDYNGFNLLVWDSADLVYYSNRYDRPPEILAPGYHGLSNHLMNTAWPKVRRGKAALESALMRGEPDGQQLLDMLFNSQRAPEEELPHTGVPLNLEIALSSMFIRTDGYGTRSSTVVLVRADGNARFIERSFNAKGEISGTVEFEIQINMDIHG